MSKKFMSAVLVLSLLLASVGYGFVLPAAALAGDELGGIRYEFEDGTLSGNASYVLDNTTVFSDFGGGGYVYIMDGSVSLDIDVPKNGNYEIYTVSGSTDGGGKCDFITVNQEPRWLTAAPEGKGVWHTGAIGTEAYQGSTVVPAAVSGGHFLHKGINTVTITASWGYAAYDSLIIVPINTEVARYELEYGDLTGDSIMKNSNIPGYYGTGFIDMWGSAGSVGVSLNFDVPESGYYQLTVRAYADAQSNRCETVILNGDEANPKLVATPSVAGGAWVESPIGAETWVDGVLHSPNPINGYYLEKGINRIQIMSNWSYGKYDSLILKKMSPVQTDDNDFAVQLECGSLLNGAQAYSALEGAHFAYVGLNEGGSASVNVSLPYAGYYHVYVRSYNTDSTANRCDKVFINNDAERFIYVSSAQANQWVNAPVSDAVYGGADVQFVPAENGYYMEKENTVTITSNYGWNCVDEILFVPAPALQFGPDVTVSGDVITAGLKTDAARFLKENISALKGEIRLADAQGNVIAPRYLGSGMKVQLVADGQVVSQYAFLVYGDMDGDGTLNILDTVLAKRAAAGLDTANSAAGDLDSDGHVTAADIAAMKQNILKNR